MGHYCEPLDDYIKSLKQPFDIYSSEFLIGFAIYFLEIYFDKSMLNRAINKKQIGPKTKRFINEFGNQAFEELLKLILSYRVGDNKYNINYLEVNHFINHVILEDLKGNHR